MQAGIVLFIIIFKPFPDPYLIPVVGHRHKGQEHRRGGKIPPHRSGDDTQVKPPDKDDRLDQGQQDEYEPFLPFHSLESEACPYVEHQQYQHEQEKSQFPTDEVPVLFREKGYAKVSQGIQGGDPQEAHHEVTAVRHAAFIGEIIGEKAINHATAQYQADQYRIGARTPQRELFFPDQAHHVVDEIDRYQGYENCCQQ